MRADDGDCCHSFDDPREGEVTTESEVPIILAAPSIIRWSLARIRRQLYSNIAMKHRNHSHDSKDIAKPFSDVPCRALAL